MSLKKWSGLLIVLLASSVDATGGVSGSGCVVSDQLMASGEIHYKTISIAGDLSDFNINQDEVIPTGEVLTTKFTIPYNLAIDSRCQMDMRIVLSKLSEEITENVTDFSFTFANQHAVSQVLQSPYKGELAVNLSLVTTKPIVVSEPVNFSSYIKISVRFD